MKKAGLSFWLAVLLLTTAFRSMGQSTYSLVPNNQNTGLTNTSYVTTETGFTFSDISWKMNQWNPKTLQFKTNLSSSTKEFYFYNTTAFSDNITEVVMTFNTLNLTSTTNSGWYLTSGTSEVGTGSLSTSGSVQGVWDSASKTLTFRVSGEATYFTIWQNGKVATGSNYLSSANSIVVTYSTGGAQQPCATPSITPASGMYVQPQNVTISCETEGASIHYSTDGSDPTEDSPTYEAPILVDTSTTIKAIAMKEGSTNSSIATAEYIIPTLLTIAEARAIQDNEFALVEGIVTFIDEHNVYIEDTTAGIDLFLNNNTVPTTLSLGDAVRAYGKKTVYNGLVELTGINGSSEAAFSVVSTGNELPLTIKTIEAVNTDYDEDNLLQSTRVKIEGAIIWAINPTGNTIIRQGDNTIMVYRIPHVDGMVQGDLVTLTGVIGCNNEPILRVASPADIQYTHRPTLAISPTTLTGMYYFLDQGPSEIMYFLLQGDHLTGNVIINASEHFEISAIGGNAFQPENPLRIIHPQSGHFNGLKIYCRLKAGLEAGQYDETQYISTENGDTIQARLIGNVVEEGGSTSQYVRINDLTALTEGSKVVLAARFNANPNDYYAMINATTGKPAGVLFTSIMTGGDEGLPVSIVAEEDNYYWTVGCDNGHYTLTNAEGKKLGYTTSTNFATGGDNVAWAITRGISDTASMVPGYTAFSIGNVNNSDRAIALNDTYKFGPYSSKSMTGGNASKYNYYIDLFVNNSVDPSVVATPTFSPPAGTYFEALSVSFTCDTEGATIHYTLDGSVPTIASPVYTSALTIDTTTTVKAFATKEGFDNSAVATATYTIQPNLAVVFNQDWEGAMNGWTFVTVSGETQWAIGTNSGNHYALANGHNNPASEAWCISPAFNLDNYDNPILRFKTAKNYTGPDMAVLFSNDYDGINPATATWTPLPCSLSEDSCWVESGDIDLSAFNGTNCHIGYKYTNTTDNAAAWEIDDCLLVRSTSLPVISVNPITLNGFNYDVENGPSAEQSFVVTASNLTDNITISESEHYEISTTSGTAFRAQTYITLTATNGIVAETSLYVRLKTGLTVGQYDNDTITIASNGASSVHVTCNGSVTEQDGDYVRISETGVIADGNRVILAARFDDNATRYLALANTLSSGKPNTTEFSSSINGNGEIVPDSIIAEEDGYYWTVNVTENGYTFTNANGDVIGYGSSGTNFVMNGERTEWTVTRGTSDTTALVPGYSGFAIINVATSNRAFAINSNHVCGAYSTSSMTGWNASNYNFYLDIFMQGEWATPTVATPSFTPVAGTYNEPQNISIECSTAEADMFFSLDSENGPWNAYTEAFEVDTSTTIWAYASKTGYNNSPVVSAEYIIQEDILVIFDQDWEGEWNGWTEVSTEGDMVWEVIDNSGNHYAYANGHNMGANEDWLISPAFNLDAHSEVTLNFKSAMNHTGPDVEVLFSNDYEGSDPATATWHTLSCELSQGNWAWTESGDISLDTYNGNSCHIAFRYTSTENTAACWEIDDIMLTSGTSTSPTITASPNTINNLNYIFEAGPSASASYQLTAANLADEGAVNILVTEGFEISLDDETYGQELDLPIANGTIVDQPVTVYVRMVADLEMGSYIGTIVHEGGQAYTEVDIAGAVVAANQPLIDALMPMYIQGKNGSNNNRVPLAVAVYIENLEPNTTYRYTNQLVDANDGETVAGVGNVIYTNENGFYRSTNPSLSTEGGYGEFTTNDSGERLFWCINETTANTRFTPGNHVFLRIRINDGHDGTDVANIFTTEDYATVLTFGNENQGDNGTAFYAASNENPMTFAMLFSNSNDRRPTYSTSIETTGIDYTGISQYASFYQNEVSGKNGYFGGILPNVNNEGVNNIRIHDMECQVIGEYYTEGGNWGSAQTANPQGGLNDIVFIDLRDLGVQTTDSEADITIWNDHHEIIIENNDDASYGLTVYDILGQSMLSQQIPGGSAQRVSHNLPVGLYIVTLSNNNATISKKIIVR